MRFRVSQRSPFGQRLLDIAVDRRKQFFDQVVEAGLRSIETGSSSTLSAALNQIRGAADNLEHLVRRGNDMVARLEGLARAQPAGTIIRAGPGDDSAMSDPELRTLMKSLGGLGQRNEPAGYQPGQIG